MFLSLLAATAEAWPAWPASRSPKRMMEMFSLSLTLSLAHSLLLAGWQAGTAGTSHPPVVQPFRSTLLRCSRWLRCCHFCCRCRCSCCCPQRERTMSKLKFSTVASLCLQPRLLKQRQRPSGLAPSPAAAPAQAQAAMPMPTPLPTPCAAQCVANGISSCKLQVASSTLHVASFNLHQVAATTLLVVVAVVVV